MGSTQGGKRCLQALVTGSSHAFGVGHDAALPLLSSPKSMPPKNSFFNRRHATPPVYGGGETTSGPLLDFKSSVTGISITARATGCAHPLKVAVNFALPFVMPSGTRTGPTKTHPQPSKGKAIFSPLPFGYVASTDTSP
jgi:hypothetical protein